MKPLEIGETATLENGDVVKCEIATDMHCHDCYFRYRDPEECNNAPCLRSERPDFENVRYIKIISPESENIEKK
jgi:hypothetical protein